MSKRGATKTGDKKYLSDLIFDNASGEAEVEIFELSLPYTLDRILIYYYLDR